MMAHQLVFVLALLVIAGGILAFGVLFGLGFFLLVVLIGSGGSFFDLYRIRRFENFSLNRLRSRLTIRPSIQPPASDSTSPNDPDSARDDDLALALAALLDECSVQSNSTIG
jgi:hypothetical protein